MKHLRKFNESNKNDKIDILKDVFHPLGDDFNIKIEISEFKIKMGERSHPSGYPSYGYLLSMIIEEKEGYAITPKYIESFLMNGSYHKEFKTMGFYDQDNSIISEYLNIEYYKVTIKPEFVGSEISNLVRSYNDIINLLETYDISLVMSQQKDWITPYGKTTLIFN